MKIRQLSESQGLSYSNLVILSLYAVFLGVIVGLIDAIFGRVLIGLSEYRDHHLFYLVPALPIAGLLIVYLYQRFAGKAAQGMGLIFKVGHNEEKQVPLRLIPLVTVTTWLTHLFGGSAGREGVAVQLGATVSHAFSRYFKIPNASRLCLTMGMAAGFGGLFQTPIAATFFALEVLTLGQLSLPFLIPTLIASFVASTTSHLLGLEKFSHFVADSLVIDLETFIKLALLGLAFGLAGNLFAYLLSLAKKKVATILPNPYYRVLLGSIVLTALLLILWKGRYTGLGTNVIALSVNGGTIYSWDWILKLLLTVFTLSLGFQGGEVTPLFAIGASLGAVLAPVLGLPIPLVAGLGYLSVFGSSTNTLLAPIFIGVEVFGPANVLPYVIVMAFAYFINHKTSIYGQQKMLEMQ